MHIYSARAGPSRDAHPEVQFYEMSSITGLEDRKRPPHPHGAVDRL